MDGNERKDLVACLAEVSDPRAERTRKHVSATPGRLLPRCLSRGTRTPALLPIARARHLDWPEDERIAHQKNDLNQPERCQRPHPREDSVLSQEVTFKIKSRLSYVGIRRGKVEPLPGQVGPENRPKRDRFLDYWHRLLLSPASRLLDEGRVTAELLEAIGAGFESVRRSDEGVLFFGFTRGKAMISEQ